MEHALLFSKVFDLKRTREKADKSVDADHSHRIAHIYLVYQNAKGPFTKDAPAHFTIGMGEGNNTKLSGATDAGIIKNKVTREKLTFNELDWLELGTNIDQIVNNISKLTEAQLIERMTIAAPDKLIKAKL